MPGNQPLDINKWAQDRLLNGKFDSMVCPKLENRNKALNYRIDQIKGKLSKLPKAASHEESIASIKSFMGKGCSYTEATARAKCQFDMEDSKLREEWRDLNEALSENNKERRDTWWNNMPETSDSD